MTMDGMTLIDDVNIRIARIKSLARGLEGACCISVSCGRQEEDEETFSHLKDMLFEEAEALAEEVEEYALGTMDEAGDGRLRDILGKED